MNKSLKQILFFILIIITAVAVLSCSGNPNTSLSDSNGSVSYEYTETDGGIRITKVHNETVQLKIPDAIDGKKVVEIGNSTFAEKNNIKKVTLPDGLLKIGYRAFSECQNLESIEFNNGLKTIEAEAFYGCNNLTSYRLPSTVTYVSPSAFSQTGENSIVDESYSVSEPFESYESIPDAGIPDASKGDESNKTESEVSEEIITSKPEVSKPDVSKPEVSEPVKSSTKFTGSDFIVMYQSDPIYASHPYGYETVGSHGCGPSTMAVIIRNLTGADVTPVTMADWSYSKGYYAKGVGSYHALIPAAAKNWGITSEAYYTYSKQFIREQLENGRLILVVMGPGTFTRSGHYMILRGFDADGKVVIADTQSPIRTSKTWDFDFIYSELKKGSPLWIFNK